MTMTITQYPMHLHQKFHSDCLPDGGVLAGGHNDPRLLEDGDGGDGALVPHQARKAALTHNVPYYHTEIHVFTSHQLQKDLFQVMKISVEIKKAKFGRDVPKCTRYKINSV